MQESARSSGGLRKAERSLLVEPRLVHIFCVDDGGVRGRACVNTSRPTCVGRRFRCQHVDDCTPDLVLHGQTVVFRRRGGSQSNAGPRPC